VYGTSDCHALNRHWYYNIMVAWSCTLLCKLTSTTC